MWENVEVGYVQGMCDLAAPLLVIFDDGESFRCKLLIELLQAFDDIIYVVQAAMT